MFALAVPLWVFGLDAWPGGIVSDPAQFDGRMFTINGADAHPPSRGGRKIQPRPSGSIKGVARRHRGRSRGHSVDIAEGPALQYRRHRGPGWWVDPLAASDNT
jgi:hypothetical protein